MKFLVLALTFLSTIVLAQTALDCPRVHVIVARGSMEPPGTGKIGKVANATIARVPGSDIEALNYPARLYPYFPSQTLGVAALTRLINNYTEICPKTKLVLMGYSQGAHVIADTLCGTSEKGFPATTPIGKKVTNNVAAVILMGDPSHVVSESYNVGSSLNDGIFPRQNPAGCDAVKSKMISFCDEGDIVCSSGNSLAIHQLNVDKYSGIAAHYAVTMADTA